MGDVRLIIDGPQSGPRNMTVDEVLLLDAVDNGIATLRFYEWSEPTLSLGYFQHYAERLQHAASRDCAAVRRQTGGGAILHDRELTYSLALPASHPLARRAGELYEIIHNAFIAALSTSQPAVAAPTRFRIRGDEAAAATPVEPFLCFQRRSPGDVILVSGGTGAGSPITGTFPASWKILGSAQRRHRGAILQHGSLLLEVSPAAPELPGLRNLTPLQIVIGEFAAAVSTELSKALDARLFLAQLSANLESKTTELTNNKYSSAVWTNRR